MVPVEQEVFLICYDGGRVESIEIDKFVDYFLDHPPLAAASLNPEFVRQIIQSIIYHFRNELRCNQIPLLDFLKLVQKLSESFITEVVGVNQPWVQLDLDKIFLGKDILFELEFYPKVRQLLKNLVRKGPGSPEAHSLPLAYPSSSPKDQRPEKFLKIQGLRQCAILLSGRSRWCKHCAAIHDEILAYIRSEAIQLATSDTVLTIFA